MANIQIRQAMPGDAGIVADILKEAALWLEQSGMPLWRENELDAASVGIHIAEELYFIAESEGDPAGTLRFQLEDSVVWPDAKAHEAAYVHRLAVRRRFAGTGLSSILLDWAVERTRGLGRQYLRLDCDAARPRLRSIYERFGFQYHSDQVFGQVPFRVARYEFDVSRSIQLRANI